MVVVKVKMCDSVHSLPRDELGGFIHTNAGRQK